MLLIMFDEYMLKNFSFYVNTPLFSLLFSIIIHYWNIYKSPTKNLSKTDEEKFIHSVYIKNSNVDLSSINIKIDDVEINDYVSNYRKSIKYPDTELKTNSNYDEIVFKKIIDEIIFFSLTCDFKNKQELMMSFHYRLNESKISDSVFFVFRDYSIYITGLMAEADKYLQQEKITFMSNYKNIIYDVSKKKKEIKKIVNCKIENFKIEIKKKFNFINEKLITLIYLFEKWIDAFNEGKEVLPVEIYSSRENENISIYGDICCVGEEELIRLIAPIINKKEEAEKKYIISKMSSGTRKKTEHYFYPSENKENELNIKNINDINDIFNKLSSDTYFKQDIQGRTKKIKFVIKHKI